MLMMSAPLARRGGGAAFRPVARALTADADAAHAVRLAAGDRGALSRAITLAESSIRGHRLRADAVLRDALAAGDAVAVAGRAALPGGGWLRVGVAGPPGAGKSTLIEALGLHCVEEHGAKVAVLATDPSSAVSKGAVLGDKTRMGGLARHPNAYVRPSADRGLAGGLGPRAYEAMALCRAAGYSLGIMETVGIGQRDVDVDRVVDVVLVVATPGGGDELQGAKMGLLEVADVVVVNKADGANSKPARRTAAQYAGALSLRRRKHPCWHVPVLTCSAETGDGVPELFDALVECGTALHDGGALAERRTAQAASTVRRQLGSALDRLVADDAALEGGVLDAAREIAQGRALPTAAAEMLLVDAVARWGEAEAAGR